MYARVIRIALSLGILFTPFANAYAQRGFAIQIDRKLLGDCWYPSAPSLKVEISATDSSDTKELEIELKCPERFSRENGSNIKTENPNVIIKTINIRDPRYPPLTVQLSTEWQAASAWPFTLNGDWIVISDISLPHQSYRFGASLLSDGQEKPLLGQLFTVDAKTGAPSVKDFVVRNKNIFQLLREKYLGRQAAYISLIIVLFGLLTAAIRKRAERLVDGLLDNLGAYSKGRLAVRRFLKRYTDYLLSTHRYLRLIGFGAAGINRPLLEEVFISLRVSPFDHKRAQAPQPNDNSVSFEAAVSQYSRLVILGGPGAGKTTTLSYIILQRIRKQEIGSFGLGIRQLPLYVPLRRLSTRDTSLLDDILSTDTQILPADILRECPDGFVKRELERGACIVLLDGLDEVIDEATHKLAADKINRMIIDYPKNRFIVTCRIAGWKGLLDEFRILEAEDLNRNEVHRFVFGWHRAVITQEYRSQIELKYKDTEERTAAWERERNDVQNVIDGTSRRLINSIESSGRLMAVATNPMLLSLICLVHYVKNILPRERPVLYEKCIELLIDAWERAKYTTPSLAPTTTVINPYQKEAILRAAAISFQTSGKGEASRSEVEHIVEAEGKKLGIQVSSRELLNQIEQRSGILIERSIDVLGFSHLTLQEYLVAKHIQLNPDAISLLEANFDNQEWREVTLLYAGLIDEATALVGKIIETDSSSRWLLAGYTLGETRRCQTELTQAIVDRLMSSFGEQGEDGETLISVMSAIAADFVIDPISPEQKLSALLMQHIKQKEHCTPAAIRVLGKARVTKALPLIVECLADSSSALEKDVIESIVLFGNIALPYVKDCIEHKRETVPISRVIAVLRAIDTAEAAKLLINCYEYWVTPSEHVAVSLTLATMLGNENIESELFRLREHDLPVGLSAPVHSEDTVWPYGDQAGSAFVRLALNIRDDIAAALPGQEERLSGEFDSAAFKLTFPAIVCYLKMVKEKISREHWQSLGFEPRSDTDLTVLERIHKDLRGSQTVFRESLKRLTTEQSSTKEVSKLVRILRWPCEILLSLLFFANAVVLTYMGLAETVRYWVHPIRGSDVEDYIVLAIEIGSLTLFLGFSIWGAQIAGQGRRFIGIVNAVPLVLRRTPYITTLRPWINFVLVQCLLCVFSWGGFVLTLLGFALVSGRLRHDVFSVFFVFLSPYLSFVLVSLWFYKYQALSVNAAALLVMQHPLGKTVLGLMSDSATAIATKMPQSTSSGFVSARRIA